MLKIEGNGLAGLNLSPRELAGLEEFEAQQQKSDGFLPDSIDREIADHADLLIVKGRRRFIPDKSIAEKHPNRAIVKDGRFLTGTVFMGEVVRRKPRLWMFEAACLGHELGQRDWQIPDGASDGFPFAEDPTDVLLLWQYNHPDLSSQAREVMWG